MASNLKNKIKSEIENIEDSFGEPVLKHLYWTRESHVKAIRKIMALSSSESKAFVCCVVCNDRLIQMIFDNKRKLTSSEYVGRSPSFRVVINYDTNEVICSSAKCMNKYKLKVKKRYQRYVESL
jgi:hypothetical protein